MSPTKHCLPSILLLTAFLIVGCDARPAVGGDGGLFVDTGIGTNDSTTPGHDAAPPRADLPGSGVFVLLDKTRYGVTEQARATIVNATSETIWMEGCTILTREREQSGSWVDQGPDAICGWAGYARALAAGVSLEQDVHFADVGRWRAALVYGLGCDPKQSLGPEVCQSMHRVHSAPADVQPTLADCNKLEEDYKKSVDFARRCDSAQSVPQCTKMVGSSLYCGCPTYVDNDAQLQKLSQRWQAWKCFELMPPCGIKCASPPPSACLGDRCLPMGD